MSSLQPHIVFAGGGTAGHLFPGIAVAEYLSRALPKVRITFALAGKSLETRLISAAGFRFVAIPSRPMPRTPAEAFSFLATSFSGYRAASHFLQQEQASLVVGLGGYASVPTARAAARRKLPLVLLEQNAVPGRATRWLASSASSICLAFEQAKPYFRDTSNVRVIGNPVRAAFGKADRHARFERGATRTRQLLVLGGSGGSRTLNDQAPRALYKARAAIAGWRIVHQTGERNAQAVRALYEKFGLPATVTTFFDDVPRMFEETDLAISRAGGTTLAELAMLGVPSILVPYEKASDNHQRQNADVFRAAGAATLVDPRDAPGRLDDRLSEAVVRLAYHTELRRRMAESMFELARPNAARAVARTIREVLRSRQLASVA